MEINAVRRGQRIIVRLMGELDHHSAEHVRQSLDMILTDVTVRELQLDMTGVTFMDSSGIALILRAQRRMQTLGGSLLVCRVPQQARRVLDAAGIDRVVTIR